MLVPGGVGCWVPEFLRIRPSPPRTMGERIDSMSAVRRHPLIAFLVLTYALTWGVLPLGIFGVAGPLVAALIVIAITDGRAGLRELGSRMIRWRVGWRWYAVAIGLPLAVHLELAPLGE